jgi:hypothetical protein
MRPFISEHNKAIQIAADRLLDELLTDPIEHAVRTAMEQKYGKEASNEENSTD